jgi:hypothetical protein
MILVVLAVANMAHADTVYTQSDLTQSLGDGAFYSECFSPLVAASATTSSVTFSASSGAGGGQIQWSLYEYYDSSCSSPTGNWRGPISGVGGYTWSGTTEQHDVGTSTTDGTAFLYDIARFYKATANFVGVYGYNTIGYGDGSGHPYLVIGSAPVPPVNDTTRIISVTPSGEATTSPVALTMQYYSSGTSTTPLDTVSLDLRSIEGGGASVLELSSAAATGTITTWVASSSATLPDGLYTAFWSLSSSESILFHIATSTQFIVGTSTWQELISLASTTPSATCSIVDIGGCMQSVITWAFIPSEQAQNLLAQSGTALLHAPPLGYFYAYSDTLRIAFSTTTIDQVMATSTRAALISITDPLQTGSIAVFWAGWLLGQYTFFKKFVLPLV